ncbi:phosphatidylserine/phosphatidylglycerophosphate/cardiolipin synthase family protein [Parasphingorhabdus sp.]|uniref:phospholipase D-like domain-containing protein n=1 Tax=Parasphingorhabdus sp. TaxID=2709688 RepID=UPI002F9555B1
MTTPVPRSQSDKSQNARGIDPGNIAGVDAEKNGVPRPDLPGPGVLSDDANWFDVSDNRLKLIQHPDDRLQALMGLIEQAQSSLKLFFYIFEADNIGQRVLDALIDACNRGVAVELMVDGFGSNGAPRDFFDPLQEAGGNFAIFCPRFSTSYLVRNHQKILISDNRRAMLGGFNIGNEYFGPQPGEDAAIQDESRWEDLGVVIEGPEVARLSEYYKDLSHWVTNTNNQIHLLQKMVHQWKPGNGKLQWLIGGPNSHLSQWAQAVKADLEQARRFDLVSAYFSPGQGLLRRIARLGKRGQGRLVLAGKTDNAATIGASRLLYGFLLKRGARLFEFQPRRLHSKLIIIDDVVYIGSANFDVRSLFINVEMMLRIEDKAFANHARLMVDGLCEESKLITKEFYDKRKGPLTWLRWAVSYFLVCVLDYTVSRRLNFGSEESEWRS